MSEVDDINSDSISRDPWCCCCLQSSTLINPCQLQ